MRNRTFFSALVGLCLTLFLGLQTYKGMAQNLQHNQAWFDISLRTTPAKNFSITPEVGYRTEPGISLNQVYLRTYFTYRPHKNLKLSLWAAQFNSHRPVNQRAIEVRTSQFVSLCWPQFNGWRFEHRLGFDQRMFYQPGYTLNRLVHRSRVRVGLHSPDFGILGSERRFYANTSFEVLRNMNQAELPQWIDHDWITAVFGLRLNSHLKLEANLLLINMLDPITLEFEREITVFRLRVKGNL